MSNNSNTKVVQPTYKVPTGLPKGDASRGQQPSSRPEPPKKK